MIRSIGATIRNIVANVRGATIHNIVANMVEYSPDLVCLRANDTIARQEWTTKLGDRIQYLTLYIEVTTTLPPINSKGLKCLALEASGDQSSELSELLPAICPISLTFLNSNPGYAALSRTPKLKLLHLDNLGIDMPLHGCPALRSVVYISVGSDLERKEKTRL